MKATTKQRSYNRDSNGMITGTVYRRYVNMPESEYDGKSYVGVTNNLKQRNESFKYHPKSYGGKKLREARESVPYDKWGIEVLATFNAATPEEYKVKSKELETAYIAKYDTFENGLNSNQGGDGMTGVALSQERKDAIGQQHKGMKHTDETKKQISDSLQGRKIKETTKKKISAGNKGKKRTPDQIEAQSKRMKAKYANGGHPVAATKGAKEWVKANGGSYWKGKNIPQSVIDQRKIDYRKTSTRIKVTDRTGNVTFYACQTDAAKATGIKDGSVNYARTHNGGLHAKTGYRFEDATDAEYNVWLAQNCAA